MMSLLYNIFRCAVPIKDKGVVVFGELGDAIVFLACFLVILVVCYGVFRFYSWLYKEMKRTPEEFDVVALFLTLFVPPGTVYVIWDLGHRYVNLFSRDGTDYGYLWFISIFWLVSLLLSLLVGLVWDVSDAFAEDATELRKWKPIWKAWIIAFLIIPFVWVVLACMLNSVELAGGFCSVILVVVMIGSMRWYGDKLDKLAAERANRKKLK